MLHQQQGKTIIETSQLRMEFVQVPAGEFLMGSDKRKDKLANYDEIPQHRVRLDEYLIGKYPVTNQQYQAFVQQANYPAPYEPDNYQVWENGKIPSGKEDHPVVQVSWKDAVAFCEWASKTSGQRIRLPSEAEWEKAARGKDGGIYPWGDQTPDAKRGNFNYNVGDTTPVGKYESGKSPYGAYDMAGNVWEWVNAWYEAYPGCDPAGSNLIYSCFGQHWRVARGVSWQRDYIDSSNVRSALRRMLGEGFKGDTVGFRCVCSS